MTGSVVGADSKESCSIRILVCGGRDYQNKDYLYSVLDQIKADLSWSDSRIESIIHGEATGADTFAKLWAITRGIPVIGYYAYWNKYGKSAGRIRNQKMLDNEKPDLVIAFPGGRGTAHMVEIARANGTEVRDFRKT